jgi:hypothetical protein
MSGKSLLQSRHETVLNQIQAAELACSRRLGSVNLLAVSKTFPAAQVLLLADLGQRAFGENYVQEAIDKIAECADQRPDLTQDKTHCGEFRVGTFHRTRKNCSASKRSTPSRNGSAPSLYSSQCLRRAK